GSARDYHRRARGVHPSYPRRQAGERGADRRGKHADRDPGPHGHRPASGNHLGGDDEIGMRRRHMHGIRWALALCAIPAALAQAPNKLTPEEKKDGFVLLFNGKDLTGWDGDPRIWSVRDGALTGSTDKNKLEHNSFLIYKDEFADFTLRFDIKLRNHN